MTALPNGASLVAGDLASVVTGAGDFGVVKVVATDDPGSTPGYPDGHVFRISQAMEAAE